MTAVAAWDDLLQGEELAYLGTEPAREPRLAPMPEGLHARVREALASVGVNGLFTHHDRWGDVLSNLRYVILDEAHVYRGVFGSHVGNVLRRLRRLARVYGADPQFLLASATIANPGELVHSLVGVDATVITGDGA